MLPSTKKLLKPKTGATVRRKARMKECELKRERINCDDVREDVSDMKYVPLTSATMRLSEIGQLKDERGSERGQLIDARASEGNQ